jgi:type I restriction enzyme R subunit
MSVHKEIAFEEEICEHLGAHGWIYVEGDSSRYNRARALFPDDVLAWVQGTQLGAWEALAKNHGPRAADTLLDRLRDSLNQRGTLDVLRQGIELLGVKGKIPLAQFKPALALNPEIQSRYQANRLRVVRQVRYSQHSENSIDLVLFLNGVPVATAELKTDFTQCVKDAIDQYRFDRDPRPKGKAPSRSSPGPAGHWSTSPSATATLPWRRSSPGRRPRFSRSTKATTAPAATP